MKARNHGPIELCVNEWIELTIPERVRNEQHVPDLQHAAFLLDHHGVEKRGRGEPRHQRGVLDRVPGVVAAPAHLLVGPVRAEELTDAERRPRDERPAAGGHNPALVGAAGEQRPHRESERHGEADVAEVEQRWAIMYGFCRLGLSPRPSSGATCVANGLATATTRKAKNKATPPSTGTTQATRSRALRRFSSTAAAA
jgi:hypothetical protein